MQRKDWVKLSGRCSVAVVLVASEVAVAVVVVEPLAAAAGAVIAQADKSLETVLVAVVENYGMWLGLALLAAAGCIQ